jgi:hypothetical protein
MMCRGFREEEEEEATGVVVDEDGEGGDGEVDVLVEDELGATVAGVGVVLIDSENPNFGVESSVFLLAVRGDSFSSAMEREGGSRTWE